MSFTRSQQGIFRPMVTRAWRKHACAEGLNPSDRKAQDAWYRAELVKAIGRDSTRDCNSGRDFDTLMAHFEIIAGGIEWNLRVQTGDTERFRWSIRQICEKWDITDAYARATAKKLLHWPGYLTSLDQITDPDDLRKVQIALLKQARRQSRRENQPATPVPSASEEAEVDDDNCPF